MSEINVFIYVALPCEAKPLINRYKLKKHSEHTAFELYTNEAVCLTVTGLGKSAMAAGVAFSQALFAPKTDPVLLNIGVAGHRQRAVGDVFVVEKITDIDSGRRYYPPLVVPLACETEAVYSFSAPHLDYRQPGLYDMEASAFYETAMRFTSAELIQLVKVVSDNPQAPADKITPQQVTALMQQPLPLIGQLIERLKTLAGRLNTVELPAFETLTQRYRFTVTEQNQLKALLARWAVISDQQVLALEELRAEKAKDVLNWLEQQLDRLDFVL